VSDGLLLVHAGSHREYGLSELCRWFVSDRAGVFFLGSVSSVPFWHLLHDAGRDGQRGLPGVFRWHIWHCLWSARQQCMLLVSSGKLQQRDEWAQLMPAVRGWHIQPELRSSVFLDVLPLSAWHIRDWPWIRGVHKLRDQHLRHGIRVDQ